MHAAGLVALLMLTADPLSPEETAQITVEQKQAQEAVNKKFDNKKSSELTPDERREMVRAQGEAEQKVLDKHGVDAKTWARQSTQKSRDQYAEQKVLQQQIVDKQKKAAEDAAKKKSGGGSKDEVSIQKGISDENPVTLDEQENEDGTVAVEKGLPPGAESDQGLAQEQDKLEGAAPASDAPAAPKAKSKSGGGRRR